MSRRFLLSTVIPALPLALAACGSKAPADPRTDAPLVRAATVQGAAAAARSFSGTVAARVQATSASVSPARCCSGWPTPARPSSAGRY